MTYHGDLYYEGKEFEIRLKEKKPGDLTDDLRTALGMPVGPNAHKVNFIILCFNFAICLKKGSKWYFVTKIILTYCEKKLFL